MRFGFLVLALMLTASVSCTNQNTARPPVENVAELLIPPVVENWDKCVEQAKGEFDPNNPLASAECSWELLIGVEELRHYIFRLAEHLGIEIPPNVREDTKPRCKCWKDVR